jgi:ABC-type nitrate/sulfonate/bicarbonate transport system substrate-binding protein
MAMSVKRTFATLCLVLGLGCSGAQAAPDKVGWGYIAATAFYWDVFAAMSKGFMAEQNIAVEDTRIDAAGQSVQMVLTSAIDILSSNTELALNAIDKDADLVIVGDETAKVPWTLMARPEIKTIKDLKGKVVGVTQLTDASTTMLKLLLKRDGVLDSEYEVIQLGGTPNRYAALTRGAVQATLLAQPQDIQAGQDGMRSLGSVSETFDGPAIVFAVRRSWAKQHADVLVRFLRAAVRGMEWVNDRNNKQQAVALLVKKIGGSEALAAQTYDLYTKQGVISRTGELPLQHVKNYLALSRPNVDSIDLKRYVDFSYLEQARQAAH